MFIDSYGKDDLLFQVYWAGAFDVLREMYPEASWFGKQCK